jgi:AcrR family transcriptional regulator
METEVQVKPRAGRPAKFARRRSQILDIASDQINVFGTRGLTLTAVAQALKLDTSSVTYYFRRKEDLAAACLQRTLEWARDCAAEASAEADPRARVRQLIHAHFALHRHQRDPAASRLAALSDLRALEGNARAPLDALHDEMVRLIRGYFRGPDTRAGRAQRNVATMTVLATIHWLPGWLDRYLDRDLSRVEARLLATLENGLAADAHWPLVLDPLEGEAVDAQTRFLHAATNMINAHGYRGASVERIVAELGVSSGSFYHHLDNKDDLVIACFERSFSLIERAAERVEYLPASAGDQLGAMISMLVAFQFTAASPLLRNGAYLALSPDLRERMMQQTARVSRHLSGLIADGVADGSLHAVDPLVVSQNVMAIINAAAKMREWAARRDLAEAVATYVGGIRVGIFQD